MVLRPIYQCAVPNLLGCVRGLRIGGEIVDLRQTGHGFRPNDPSWLYDYELIRIGCELGCSSLDCKNSGHCSVGWLGNGDVTCDCSRTSYAGSDCTVDNGLILAANSYFTFDMDRFLSRYILSPMKRTQTLQFAFAPSSPSTHHQILATVQFKDERSVTYC
ncbi:EGF-like domain protein [Necator americanus]|uniref:EGF-like domain protein n=1 Tax=Necator americanus TaxID=51031 RepID=W2TTR5_NECAM|nr:EGF-like domain protein [Necator americanus]ETN85178.1 EGF-like domain protein [Necator americanus]